MTANINNIQKQSIASLGYEFVSPQYLPKGKDEYYLREMQNKNGIKYRTLSAYEVEVMVRNRNTSDNWNSILVSDAFNPELVKNCKFFGLVRIGKLESFFLEFSDLKVPVGLYNSTIISCDFGSNVVIDNVNYLSHYIIGSEVIITNVNELVATDHAKFGNGIVKDGEEEEVRIWLEVCNESGGRKIIPFNAMEAGDAYLWSKFRNKEPLLQKFKEFTEAKFDKKRGYYGKIGDRTVIKNCRIIKDVWIGTDAYLKGANKLKNLTINSGNEGMSQIGEGCELVNGIIGFGCRVFYGVKAVRFIMANHSQLKYGARLINSYLGNNSTISCCEVLNSLIFPAHEQHHNNSFLCASTIMGQSNIPAGATIGSNHNSRSADGEIVAGRGFWPGLCVSLKHNSKFACFTMVAKGDYPAELNIPIPFSLISHDVPRDRIVVMPAYWFMYNMYALERNVWKYRNRDNRKEKVQYLEYDYLAPDSINEIVVSIKLLEKFAGKAFYRMTEPANEFTDEDATAKGKELFDGKNPVLEEMEVLADDFENSKRKVVIIKIVKSYSVFNELINFYCVNQLMELIDNHKVSSYDALISLLPGNVNLCEWMNVGGQLMLRSQIDLIMKEIIDGEIRSWDDLHLVYKQQGTLYPMQKLAHALSALKLGSGIQIQKTAREHFNQLLYSALSTKEWMVENIYQSRAKDYTNKYRKLPYDNQEEMDKVVGKLEANSFIQQQKDELVSYKKRINCYLNWN